MVGMSCHQCRDDGAQEGFAAAPGVVHELEEAEILEERVGGVYSVHARIRKSLGEMTRKLSDTASQ